MVKQSLSKATRLKHLKVVLSLSKMIKKDWKDVTKDDVDTLVYRIM
jgi:5-bromo-4-chloroindolyl phosphate hydrolysis protein